MKKVTTTTTTKFQCDHPGCKRFCTIEADALAPGWVERNQKTFCPKHAEDIADWIDSPEGIKKRKEFQENLLKFIEESSVVIKQRDEALAKAKTLSAKLEKLSETYGIPLEDSEGYFATNGEYGGSASYIPNSFLDKEYWKLFREGYSGYEGVKQQIPSQVLEFFYEIRSEDDVNVGWNSSSC